MNTSLSIFWRAALAALEQAGGNVGDDERGMATADDGALLDWCDDLADRVGLHVDAMREFVTAYCVERAGEWDNAAARADAMWRAVVALSDAGETLTAEQEHAAHAEGADDAYLDANTGGGVWVSYSRRGDVLTVFSDNGFMLYRIPAGITARDASEILWAECGDVPAGWEIV